VPKVSVTVITRDEARNIAAALESVAWADEIVVVDSGSTDDTVAIARRFTDHVVVREWPGYVAQKNHAASIASHDWIFSLDADERVTPALAAEIRDVMSRDPREARGQTTAAYQVPRVTWHLGRWIRSTDWYPDHQVRLYDRHRARWTGQYVHEALSADGPVDTLRGDLQHFPFRDIADHLDAINRYTTYSAKQMYESGRRAGLPQIIGHPPLAFLRNYIAKGGIRDGGPGLVISAMNAYYVFLKFAKLWELSRVQGSGFKVQGSVEPRTGNEEPRTKNPEP
jgi:glycosyltransferase involved in cell wall biosynthesis